MNQASSDGVPYRVPREPGRWRAIALAAVVHLALFAFLWIGIRWQNETPVAVEAEVWSPQAREAAPRAVAPPPAPPPEPVQQPAPRPAPVTVKPPPQVEAPPDRTPDIVLEREREHKRQLKQAKERELAQAEAERARAAEEAQRRKAQQAADEARQMKAQQRAEQQVAQKRLAQQEAADQKRLADMEKTKKAEEQKKQLAARQKEAAVEAQKEKAQHDANLRRLMAGVDAPSNSNAATGSGGNGEAARSQGSRADASYTQKVGAKIKSNTIFNGADELTSNPAVEFAVELLPDGSIRRLRKTKSSGVPGFDEAVTRAIEKSAPFPPDKSGMAPSGFTVSHRPKDQ